MIRARHLLVAAIAAALWVAAATGRVASQSPTPASAQAPATPRGDPEKGKALYSKNACYQCHNNEAQGGAAGPRLGPDPIPLQRFVAYVRAPRGEMPPYTATVMSDQELADVYAFVQARPRPPAIGSIPLLLSEVIEVDNTWVRARRVQQASHEQSPPGERPNSVIVYLTDARQRITGADGKAREVSHKAGDVAWNDASTRSVESLSDRPIEMIVTELKTGAKPPASSPATLDPVKLDPQHHLVPIENARVRVLRTILEPHVKSPMHDHPHYVVVYLTELHTTMKLADGRVVDNPRRAGEVAWRDALRHETEQTGDATAEEIQIEVK